MTLDVHPFYARCEASSRGLRRLAWRLVPLPSYLVLRTELHLLKVRLLSARTAARFRGARDLLVNVGAGSAGRAGWVNVDMWPGPGVNCVYDCRTSLPFPDRSVRGIFAEHFLEHLDYTLEAPQFLRECRRVLGDGATLRLAVPDAGRYLHAYAEPGWEGMTALRSLGPGREDPWLGGRYDTKMQLVNAVFRQGHEHRYAYDFQTLALLLEACGFREIVKSTFGQSRQPELALDRADRAPESLYVEAIASQGTQ